MGAEPRFVGRDRRPRSGDATLPNGEATGLLRAWSRGDLHARDRLLRLLYTDLRRRAAAYLRRERADHTLQPTALVHEAFLRFVGQERIAWQDRAHFLGVAAQMMRRVLVDHARARGRTKRLGAVVKVALNDRVGAVQPFDGELLLIDQALTDLAALDSRQAQIVELRYFGGLTDSEVARMLRISRSTVTREWQIAKGWLYRRITTGRGLP